MNIVACVHGPGLGELELVVYILWAVAILSGFCTLPMILLPRSSARQRLIQAGLMLTYFIPTAGLFLASDAMARAGGTDFVIYCAIGAPALAVLHCVCLAVMRIWQRMRRRAQGQSATA
jgi:hypothetical protein